jgi:hypothetical protein
MSQTQYLGYARCSSKSCRTSRNRLFLDRSLLSKLLLPRLLYLPLQLPDPRLERPTRSRSLSFSRPSRPRKKKFPRQKLTSQDQSNSFVNNTLVKWIYNTVTGYGFDGIRIDTVPEVDKDFWYGYVASSGVYSVGEVFNGDIDYVAEYVQPQGPLAGALSYPLFFTLRSVFASQQSMYQLQSINQQYSSSFGNGVNLMGI